MIGQNFRSGTVLQGQPLGMIYQQVLLTVDNQVLNPVPTTGALSLFYVGSDSTTATDRTFTILPSPIPGHVLTMIFYTGSSTTAQLVDTGAMRLGSNWTPTQYDLLQLVSDGTNWLEMTRGPTAISAGAVTLASLASGISPSHVVKYGGTHTTTGGSASEAITVTGAAATDLVSVALRDNGTNNVTILTAVPSTNTVTVTFSADPGNDAILNYLVFRAAT